MRSPRVKGPVVALSALAALCPGLLFAGCGSGDGATSGTGATATGRQASAATDSPIPGVPRLRTRGELDAWVAQKSNPDVRPVVFFCNRATEHICEYYNQFPTWFHTVMDGRGLGDEMRARTAYVNTMDVPDWPYRGSVTVTGLTAVRYRGGDSIGRFTIMSGTSWQAACRALLIGYDTRLPDSACPGQPPKG